MELKPIPTPADAGAIRAGVSLAPNSPTRRKKVMIFLLILIAVLLEASAQLLYKAGVNQLPPPSAPLWHLPALWDFTWSALGNWRVLLGIGLYIPEVILWWAILSKVEVSYAFPLTSMSYVLLLLMAKFFLHEDIPLERWLGALAVVTGVFLITRSAGTSRH